MTPLIAARSTMIAARSTIADQSVMSQSDELTAMPETPDRLWYSRGKMLTQQGNYQAALESFDVALKLYPQQSKTWIFRGVVLTHLQLYESALMSFDRALELRTNDRDAWIFRGAVLNYLNRPAEASESYSTALKLQSQLPANDPPCDKDYPMWLPIG